MGYGKGLLVKYRTKDLPGARTQQGFSCLPSLEAPRENGSGEGSQALPWRGICGMGKSVPFSSLYCHDSGLGKERNTVNATTGGF